MLIRITECCTMNCSHCLVEASPSGKHMEEAIFRDTLRFNSKIDPAMLFISGGEPTDHPQFIEFMKIAKREKNAIILVASNGLFAYDERYTKELLALGIQFQITHDSRYYPKPIKRISHPNVVYEDIVRKIFPSGRAITNNLEITTNAPNCFNLRSTCRSLDKFLGAIIHLRYRANKFCTPSVNVDGTIVAGESTSCYKIGTIYSSHEDLLNNLNHMHCGKCGLYKNLSGEHRDLWDDMEEI